MLRDALADLADDLPLVDQRPRLGGLVHSGDTAWHSCTAPHGRPVSQPRRNATSRPVGVSGLVLSRQTGTGRVPGWPDVTLVRGRDRRLLFAELVRETGTLSYRRRLMLDLLRSLEWDRSDDEQRRAELAGGRQEDPPAESDV